MVTEQARVRSAGREGTPVLTVMNDDASTRDGSLIDEIVREGARRMLAAALEAEVNQYIAELAAETDERGRRLVVRNGHHRARTVATAAGAIEAFAKTYGTKWPKAVAKITDDQEELLAFYDFPAEHWVHLRTTNPIESTFSTVKLRTRVTRGAGSPAAALAMVFKLVESAQARWRAITGAHLVALVRAGARFECGIQVEREEDTAA
jgi:transposase-like protein